MTTEVKVGGTSAEKETVTQTLDVIPILAEMQLVEGLVATDDESADTNTNTAHAADKGKTAHATAATEKSADSGTASQPAASASKPTENEKAVAVQQARQQLQRGDRQAAIETLRLVDLGLVSRVVSMPLNESSSHVDKAIALIDEGKLHDANLELKQAKSAIDKG